MLQVALEMVTLLLFYKKETTGTTCTSKTVSHVRLEQNWRSTYQFWIFIVLQEMSGFFLSYWYRTFNEITTFFCVYRWTYTSFLSRNFKEEREMHSGIFISAGGKLFSLWGARHEWRFQAANRKYWMRVVVTFLEFAVPEHQNYFSFTQ